MAIGFSSIPFAGFVVDLVSGIAGVAIMLTGLFAGAFRALAVLGRSSPERVEWLTAAGFAGGIAVAVLFLALDVVLG